MGKYREVDRVLKSKPTIEGAGVHLKRAFGYYEVPLLDPFLLLDDFHSDNPDDYIAGFPWHPHRGIETVTYMLHGNMKHQDSMGNSGIIKGGEIQWMTAGSGIIHSEMPGQDKGLLWGFQLWTNLPASNKFMNPRYQDIARDQIPEVSLNDAVTVRVLCGEYGKEKGPVRDIVVDPEYLDVTVSPHSTFKHSVKKGYTCFAYVYEGNVYTPSSGNKDFSQETVVIFKDGELLEISAKAHAGRFLLVSGKPIGEPVAWRGPIVMNTEEELDIAFEEYRNGTFIKNR
ncbi:MAG: pirin family protein [Spirochaetota bacterium]|nr:MAG: pirin family protein [Spirochaetota bacterium]